MGNGGLPWLPELPEQIVVAGQLRPHPQRVGVSLSGDGGEAAMQLRIAEQYVEQFGGLARAANTLVIPANLSDVSSMIALATKVAKSNGSAEASATTS